jgi:D-alanyl-D-alanine dipeptidase
MKPYHRIPIQECGEPLVAIPAQLFSWVTPHPYQVLGAPYEDKSPYYLRRRVVERLMSAQQQLQQEHPGWQIQIFDAYRPIAVQQFMVDYSFADLLRTKGTSLADLSTAEERSLLEEIYQFWAPPSLDPDMPPPHSTGAAVDITLVDDVGKTVDMGSPIDELSIRSFPDHFADSSNFLEHQYHENRQLLNRVMAIAGFQRHPNEWWHFSWGDQMWAWLRNLSYSNRSAIAHYGRIH